jgi:hypothetical protein
MYKASSLVLAALLAAPLDARIPGESLEVMQANARSRDASDQLIEVGDWTVSYVCCVAHKSFLTSRNLSDFRWSTRRLATTLFPATRVRRCH